MTPLEQQFEKFEAALIRKEIFQPAPAWDDKTNETKLERLERAKNDFWYFDKTYFPPKSHRQGYSKPGHLHKQILHASTEPGIHWFATHRGLAKTAYLLKVRLWQLLFGHSNIAVGGFYSEVLPKARYLVKGLEFFLKDNPRIRQDFNTKIIESNDDMLAFSCDSNPHGTCRVLPFSNDRSPRGSYLLGSRLDFIDFDDLETLKSSFDKELVNKRIDKVLEAFRSTAGQNGSLCMSNNLHPSCSFNILWKEEQKGIKRKNFNLYPYPDWSNNKALFGYKGSVWKEAFPAKSEAEMREMRKIDSDHEWSQAQCNPQLRSGRFFSAEFYREYAPDDMPSDVLGVAYCDQNHSIKNSGDTTAMGALLYSPSQRKYYVWKPICRSYSNPNKLIEDFFGLFHERIYMYGMDGNVSQEATWRHHLENWARINQKPPLPIKFLRYNVDNHVEMVRLPYMAGDILFPQDFGNTEDGERFKDQLFSFDGKKANKKDDAPDWLICAYALGLEMNYFNPSFGAKESSYFKDFGSSFSW